LAQAVLVSLPYAFVRRVAGALNSTMKRFQPKASGYTGVVKSWNGVKGFGFITSEKIHGDVMFLRTDLPSDATEVRDKFLNGKSVTFDAASGPDGRARASNVQISAAEGELMAGSIKSFSERHGYGFISSSSFEGDIRFNMSHLEDLKPGCNIKGELVIFKAESRPDGKINAEKVMFQSGKIAKRLKADGGAQGDAPQQQLAIQMPGFIQGMKRGAAPMGGGFGKKQNISQGTVPTMATGNHLKGMVKSYNTGKGFGFISAAGVPGDIFFMRTALPPQAQEDRNLSGQSVGFELATTMDGKMRAESITLT